MPFDPKDGPRRYHAIWHNGLGGKRGCGVGTTPGEAAEWAWTHYVEMYLQAERRNGDFTLRGERPGFVCEGIAS
jgi:hypothetical protein